MTSTPTITLNVEQMALITSAFDSAFEKGDDERRQHHRLPLGTRAQLVRFKGKSALPPTNVTIRDISVSGIGLLHSEPIPAEEQFAVRVPTRKGASLWLVCTCARWQPISEQLYLVGGKFVRVVNVAHTDAGTNAAASTASVPASANAA
jgi:hypothetical protein